jgi:IclR family transcriptional regulator, acetate operon repressor
MEDVPSRPGSSMKTIDKALKLLDFFTTETPEFRLSDLARAASVDKATALRILNSLASGGLIEQSPETKKYRLGTAVLRLARIRETCFPIVSVLQPIVDRLAEATGESAHVGLASEVGLTTIALCEPNRATRVWIDPTQVLPFHATASGLAFLAFSPPEFCRQWLERGEVRRFTDETLVTADDLIARLADIRARGLAFSAGTLESDVVGVAAPIFDWHRKVIATIAVACVRSRLTDAVRAQIETEVAAAAADATRALGG